MLSLGFLLFVFGAACECLEARPGEGRDRCNDRLTHIERFLSRQENLIRQLNAKVSEQEHKLSRQETLIGQQDDKLSRQEILIGQQDDKLSRQEILIGQQDDKLSRQEILIGQQRDNYNSLLSEFRKLQQQLRGGQLVRHDDTAPKAGAGQREGGPTAHDVETRSDDLGPLEAVVTQLSQKVTEIQALQTQSIASTSADIQTLKASTSVDIQTLKARNSQQDLAIQDAGTSTFVQWGSSTCAASSTLIYSGAVGGSFYDHSGAAANYLCLTLSPVLLSTDVHTNSHGEAYLYGGEYQTNGQQYDMDPVCAVCRSTFAATVMIPGTNVCSPGWHKQYSGYLMAGAYNFHAASEYICVDSKLESSARSVQNDNGALLYYVRTRCGSLPCTPYFNDRVVTCAVCSK